MYLTNIIYYNYTAIHFLPQNICILDSVLRTPIIDKIRVVYGVTPHVQPTYIFKASSTKDGQICFK